MPNTRDSDNEETTQSTEPTAASRRTFLKGVGAVTAGGVMATMHGTVMGQAASAASGEVTNVLVVLSLRGGADGMSLVVPYGDPGYAVARPKTAIPPSSLLLTNKTFGLHPKLAPLQQMWRNGQMAAVSAVGQPVQNLSHFSATLALEEANPGSSDYVGWVNRLVGGSDPDLLFSASQIGETVPHTCVYGPQPTLATVDIDNVAVTGPANAMAQRLAALDVTWDQASGTLGTAVRQSLDTATQFAPVLQLPADPQNGAQYPATDLGDALAQSARAIRANSGVQVICVDHVGWDMHFGVGTLQNGRMLVMVDELANAVNAFFVDLGDLAANVTLVTQTEFGRRVEENGDGGLDHGWASTTLLFGAGVKGGYYGKWPLCDPSHTAAGSLKVTTDYRSVLTEVIANRFPGTDLSAVFPNFTPKSVGVMQGA